MSSFEFKIEHVSGSTARISAQVIHPDQWDISGEKNFALQIIIHAFWVSKMGYLFGTQPLKNDAFSRYARASPVFEELENLLELMNGRQEKITEAEFDELNLGRGTDGLSGWGSVGSTFHKQHPTDYDRFCREAEQIVKNVRLVDELNNPKSKVDDPDPSATLLIELANEEYAAHLLAGMRWESAIYEYSYYRTVWDDPAFFEPGPCPDFAQPDKTFDVFDGEREAGTPEFVAFSSTDGKMLFSSQMAEVVAMQDDEEVWRKNPELRFALLSTQDDLVALSYYGVRHSFSLSDGSLVEVENHSSPSPFRIVSPSGRYRVDIGNDETEIFFDGRSFVAPTIIDAVAFSSDESMVAIGLDNLVILADPATTETISTIPIESYCRHVAFSHDGTLLSVGTRGKFVEIYRVSDGTRLTRMGGEHYLPSAAWSPDGKFIVVTHVDDQDGFGGYYVRYPVVDCF